MNKTAILFPYELEYCFEGIWHPYGRYTSLDETRRRKSEAIRYDEVEEVHFEYRIIEIKVIE